MRAGTTTRVNRTRNSENPYPYGPPRPHMHTDLLSQAHRRAKATARRQIKDVLKGRNR